MKSNKELGYQNVVAVGNYTLGVKCSSTKYRAYGYEWDSHQDISLEQAHHEVCGRGATAEEAINNMIDAAIESGRVEEQVHNCQTVFGLSADQANVLRRELLEELAELDD